MNLKLISVIYCVDSHYSSLFVSEISRFHKIIRFDILPSRTTRSHLANILCISPDRWIHTIQAPSGLRKSFDIIAYGIGLSIE